jgi:hypothetical protein
MDRRAMSVLLLVLAGCTGKYVPTGTTASAGAPIPPSTTRARTILDMEVGPSVHPGSFRAAGTVADGLGAPVPGATVTVTLTSVGGAGTSAAFDLGTRKTDQNGSFQVTFHLPRKGTFLVQARFAGDARHEAAFDQGPITGT